MEETRKQRLLKSAADLVGREALATRMRVAESLDELADPVSSKPKPSSLRERDR